MQAYIYRAALYCVSCAEGIKARVYVKPFGEIPEDSDQYPQGPFGSGGGEADTPQHCDGCGVFLENPLTDDGREYVREAVGLASEERRTKGHHDFQSVALDVWAAFYGIKSGEDE